MAKWNCQVMPTKMKSQFCCVDGPVLYADCWTQVHWWGPLQWGLFGTQPGHLAEPIFWRTANSIPADILSVLRFICPVSDPGCTALWDTDFLLPQGGRHSPRYCSMSDLGGSLSQRLISVNKNTWRLSVIWTNLNIGVGLAMCFRKGLKQL